MLGRLKPAPTTAPTTVPTTAPAEVRALDPDGALLVIGLARDRIERALRHPIRVEFRPVKRHEHLSWRNRFSDAELELRHDAAAGDEIDEIGGLEFERTR